MNYTTGNWTVSDLVADSSTTTKNIAVPDLTWSDYAKTQDEPNEAILANATSVEVISPESVRFCSTKVNNVYNKRNIDVNAQAPVKSGVQVMSELKFNLRAVNSVSGQEIDLPFTGRIVLMVPSYQAVNSTAIEYALKRTISAAFNDSSDVSAARILELARGSLIPE